MTEVKETKVKEEVNTVTEQKRFTVFGTPFAYLCLLGIAFALLGWIAENTAKAISEGVIDSRFHTLPFISPYALIPFAFHIVLGSPNSTCFFGKKLFAFEGRRTVIYSNLIAFGSICLLVFLGELVVGNMWDIFFGVELWDYSDMPLHLTQYTGVISTFGFGTGVYLLFKFAYTPALTILQKKISYKTAKWIAATIGTLIVLDTVLLMIQIIFFGKAHMLWQINIR